MKNLKPIEIANKIIEFSGINIFKNTRQRKYVEYRALLANILRNRLSMRWTNIAVFFRSQGKDMDHATVMYSTRQYKMYKKHNKKLEEIEKIFTFKSDLNYDEIDRIHYLENKCNSCETKLKEPLVKLVRDIPEDRTADVEENIKRLMKAWEWKEKVL